jgi:predicted metalloprotease with PDZ domain
MKKLLILFLSAIFFASAGIHAQNKSPYQFTIDLKNVADDKVNVQLIAPVISKDEIVYYLPKIVPGTYSIDDFGRYVENFKAYDKKGALLKVEKTDVNGWKISGAKKLSKITYTVNDTFDDTTEGKKIFEPVGSNIQADTNYVINTHCFLGYFDGMKEQPYKLTVLHKPGMYASSPMNDLDQKAETDRFESESFNRIADSPIMYSEPDTSSIHIGDAEVLISVYSPNKKVHAAFLAKHLDTLLQAQAKYLGGKLPVKKYAFLIYLTDKGGVSGGMGALEHSYSSVYFLPEQDEVSIAEFFVDVAAHEFFHIVTPLSIHSEEIHYFDFNDPKMSKHLWLYEGTTEYHAHLVQVRYGINSKEEFLKKMQEKITGSRQQYNDTVPFTVMSSNVLKQYANQFGNVYQKGALIAMCLDIKLRSLSKGKTGLIDLVGQLSKKYGKDKPFKDDELFEEIGKLSSPEIKTFLETYVAGPSPLPLEAVFAEAGVEYFAELESKDSTFTLGSIQFLPNAETGKLVISNVSKMNAFGTAIGYRQGDEIQLINGKEFNAQNANATIGALYRSAKAGDSIVIAVKRKNEGTGEIADVNLTGKMMKIPVKRLNVLRFKEGITPEQQVVQDSWLSAR